LKNDVHQFLYLFLDNPSGKPQSLLKFSTEGKIEIDNEILTRCFEYSEVSQRKIVAFSIIGAYRKGKSLFMNYCLRYLYANVRIYIHF